MGVEIVRQGYDEKLAVTREIMQTLGLAPHNVAYIGDDLPDLAAMQFVGLAVAVADAAAEIRQAAHLVTSAAGGQGAVREAVETILKAQRRWDEVVLRHSLQLRS
jgi:YrbI family 3-deoxy-D-manno-octulosonate 8-phosphate phosphatase